MNETRVPAGPERNPVWVTRLSELIDRLYLVIRVNAVWWMLSLLGLMVAGVGPASCAAAEAFIAARHGERVRVLPLMWATYQDRSEEHTSELQSRGHIVCRLLLEKKKSSS